MKSQDQLIYSKPGEILDDGDCFRACVAAIIDEDGKNLPNFVNESTDTHWWPETTKWLHERGWGTFCVEREDISKVFASYPGYWIACVDSGSKDGEAHAILMKGMNYFHDPHPITREIDYYKDATILDAEYMYLIFRRNDE